MRIIMDTVESWRLHIAALRGRVDAAALVADALRHVRDVQRQIDVARAAMAEDRKKIEELEQKISALRASKSELDTR